MATSKTSNFEEQVAAGARFEFGKNWARFLDVVNDDRLDEAKRSLADMLGVDRLDGRSVLDVGSGSGLFSLASVQLGARRVHSFDFDPDSVACTRALKLRFSPESAHWTIERGSALDAEYLAQLGQWDLVYSWGVLHHTGAMWEALANACSRVAAGGTLFIAIYNDQGVPSQWWRQVKRIYNSGAFGRAAVCGAYFPYFALTGLGADLVNRRNPIQRYREYKRLRGMSIIRDWVDWLGGLPFEVARPEEVFEFCMSRGFQLIRLKTCGGRLGCNEFVFRKVLEGGPAGQGGPPPETIMKNHVTLGWSS